MSNPANEKEKRKRRLNDVERMEIIEKMQNTSGKSQRAIAREYGVSHVAIIRTIKQKEVIKNRVQNVPDSTRARTFRASNPSFPVIEDKLFDWIQDCQSKNIEVSAALVKAKAMEIAAQEGIADTFRASWKWLSNFRRRKNLQHILSRDAAREPDKHELQEGEDLQRFYRVASQYSPEDVYIVDETGLFYRLLPGSLHAVCEQESSGEQAKDRVTLIACSNATGSHKLPVTLVGRVARPACIQRRQWPIPYFSQRRAWVDEEVSARWFEEVFLPTVRERTNRSILLLIINSQGRFCKPVERDRVRVLFFPPSGIGQREYFHQGVIAALKRRYKHQYLKEILNFHSLDMNYLQQLKTSAKALRRGVAGVKFGQPAHLLDAAEFVKAAWDTISPQAIQECLRKAEIGIRFSNQVDKVRGQPAVQVGPSVEDQDLLVAMNESGIHEIAPEDMHAYLHADDDDSQQYMEALLKEVDSDMNVSEHLAPDDSAAMEDEAEETRERKFSGWAHMCSALQSVQSELYHPDAAESAGEHYETLIGTFEKLNVLIRGLRMEERRSNQGSSLPLR